MIGDATRLGEVLASLPVLPFDGILYRAVTHRALIGDPPYPEIRPLYDAGAPSSGARYTPRGGMKSLYLAADPETAFAEVNQIYAKLRRQSPPVMAPVPACTLFSVAARIERVLDLTDIAIQSALETNEAELSAPWRESQQSGTLPPTQWLGRAAYDTTVIQALRYPSMQLPGHACFVVFTERLQGNTFIEVDDASGYLRERLPQ